MYTGRPTGHEGHSRTWGSWAGEGRSCTGLTLGTDVPTCPRSVRGKRSWDLHLHALNMGGGAHEEGMAHGLMAHTDVVNI